MLAWLIIGGGIHGVHLAYLLTTAKGVSREELRVLDPHPEPLARWNRLTANTGMAYLRSPAVHNLGLTADALDTFAASPAATEGNSYPITVTSCGEPMTFAAAPERMVVFENNLLEIALLLGLQERIVGIWTGSELSVDPTVQAAAAQLTAISTEGWPPPALEPVLGVEPDFVWSGWGYGFSEESGLTPARLLALGISSYATTESCSKAGVGEAVTIESTYTDILTIGRIFGVEAAAQTLVDGMQSRIDAAVATVGPVERPLRVFYYDSGEAEPFTAGSLGMPSVMMRLVGGENRVVPL